jgi:hypothetical protein
MTTEPPRSYTRLAVAIIIAGVLVSATLYAAVGQAERTITSTSTNTTTDYTTDSLTITSTVSTTACTISSATGVSPCTTTQTATETSNASELVFRQITPCPNLGYFGPWSVTLSNGESATALNANFSQCCSASPGNPSIIAFLVANGNYSYSVTPTNRFTPTTGTVTVDNQEVVVNLDVLMASCGSTTTTSSASTETTATNPTNALELQLSLNASSSSATGVSVSILVDAYNPLSTTVNVTAADDWMVPLNGVNGAPCGDDGPTVGFAIAAGYYSSSNVTAAKFLDLVDPGATYACTLYLGYGDPTGFLFQPMSDMAASYGCNQQTCMSGSASTALTSSSWGTVTGYWTQGGAFTSFPRGVYTVVAEDEWGNTSLAYFTVS